MVNLLLQNGTDPNNKGNTSVHVAMPYGYLYRYIDMIELLLNYNTDLNIQNNDSN
jgi:ankyrin repeat protein